MGSTATVAVLFCDWVASTERQTRLGDIVADDLRKRVFHVLRGCVADTDGTVVKGTGDGCMAVFERSTIGAIECARLMHERIAMVDPDDPVHLRIGVSAGEAAFDPDDGDWYGTPVVEAARLCDAAAADQTLAPALVMALVGSRGAEHGFRRIGQRELKGFVQPVAVVEVDGGEVGDEGWEGVEDVAAVGAPFGGDPAAEQPEGVGPPSDGADSDARRGGRRTGRILVASTVAVVALAVVVVVLTMRSHDGGSAQVSAGADPSSEGVRAPTDYQPTFAEVDCPAEVTDDVPDAECGELTVPESRDEPDGRQLALPVTIAPHEGSDADPVLLLDINEQLSNSSFRGTTEVIELGVRGFGDPAYGRCEGVATVWKAALARPVGDPESLDRKAEAAKACADSLRDADIDLDSYNLEQVALDMRDLLVARGPDRVTVAAGGYSTPAAVDFARSNPGAVGAMVLTNPIPPGESLQASPVANVSGGFSRVADLCADDAACTEAFGDMDALYERTWEDAEEEPVEVTTMSLSGEGPFTVLLDGHRVGAAVEAALQDSRQVGLLPGALDGASDALVAAAGINEDIGTYISEQAPNGTLLALLCSYDMAFNRTAEIAAAHTARFSGASDPAFQRVCQAIGVPSVGDALDQPLDMPIPVFLSEGGLWAAGVKGWAEQMADELPRAVVAVFPTISADLAGDPPACLRDLRAEFVADPEGFDDSGVEACEAESPEIDFGLG